MTFHDDVPSNLLDIPTLWSIAYVHVPKEKRVKLDSHTNKGLESLVAGSRGGYYVTGYYF